MVVTRGGESVRSIRLISPAAAGMQYEAKLKLKGEVHTNEARQSRRSLRTDDEDQI